MMQANRDMQQFPIVGSDVATAKLSSKEACLQVGEVYPWNNRIESDAVYSRRSSEYTVNAAPSNCSPTSMEQVQTHACTLAGMLG